MSANDEKDMDREAALAQLTDEERAALEEDELTPDQRATLEEIADDDDEGEDASEGNKDQDEDDSGGAEEASDDGKKAAADGQDDGGEVADAGGQDDGSEDDDDDFVPTYKFALPDDFDAQVTAVDAAEAELSAKFKAGDIDTEEFLAENRKISEDRRKLDALRIKAEIADGMSTQTVEQQWERKLTRFMGKNQNGIDYMTNEAARADFDASLRALGNNPAYNDKGFDWFIEKAHKMTLALNPQEAKPAPKVDAGDKGGKKDDKPKPAARKPNVDKIPASLANVPGGDGPGDVQDEFAEIDKLDGLEYETALARMTPAQRERYLASA